MCRVRFGHPGVNEVGVAHTPSRTCKTGAEPLGSAPLDACVRTTDSLVVAEVGHGLVGEGTRSLRRTGECAY